MTQDLQEMGQALGHWLESLTPNEGRVCVQEIKRSDGGFSNVTILFHAHWLELDVVRNLVLRMQPESSSVFPDCDIVKQYRVMTGLARSDVPVPHLLGIETGTSVLGAPFFVMDRVTGQVPNENPLYHLEGWFHDLPVDQLEAHWFSGIDTIARISKLDWQALGLQFLAPTSQSTPLAAQLAYYRNAISWAEDLGRPYPHLHRAWDWLMSHQPRNEAVALSWGDAKLGNCVFHEGKVAAALDWEMAALANPVDDLAWWLMLDESTSRGYGVPRLPGLPSREATITRWEKVSGHSAQDLPYYDVYAAWRMAYIMARIGTIFTQRGWVPKDMEMDIRNGGATLLAEHAQRLKF